MARVLATNGEPTYGEYVRPAQDRLRDARAQGYKPLDDYLSDKEQDALKRATADVARFNDRILNRYRYEAIGPDGVTELKRKRAGARRRRDTLIKKAEQRRDQDG